MAASVRIEDEAFSDGRYDELAEYAGLADGDHARSKMEHLWRQCTIEKRYSLPAFLVTKHLGSRGVEAIIRARLGEQNDDGTIRIRGTKGRIEWLDKLRKNGRKGGRPNKYQKKPNGFDSEKPNAPPLGFENQNPPAPAPALALKEDIASHEATPFEALADKVDAATGDVGKQRAKPVRDRRKATAHPDHAAAVEAFDAYYRRTHGGSKPTWNGKTGSLIAGLLRSHGLVEIQRRLTVLESVPDKLFPPPPWDLPTFSQHGDKLPALSSVLPRVAPTQLDSDGEPELGGHRW